jgi:hypothetical protein
MYYEFLLFLYSMIARYALQANHAEPIRLLVSFLDVSKEARGRK